MKNHPVTARFLPPSGTPRVSQQQFIRLLCALVLGNSVDWPAATDVGFYDKLLNESIRQGVDALIAYRLKTCPAAWSKIPDAFQARLLQRLSNAVAGEMVRARDVIVLQQAMAKQGIEFLVIKGGALSYTHYSKPYLRSRVDTDIFIGASNIASIRNQLTNRGYELRGWVYKSHQFNALRKGFGGELIKYDVHWRSNNRSDYARIIDFDEALQQAVPIPGLGTCLTLCPVHSLLQACLHLAASIHHTPDRLIWLYDIHLLVSDMSESDLLEFAGVAAGKNVQTICLEAVERSEHYFLTEIPSRVRQVLTTESAGTAGGGRFTNSQLALILDDFRRLPDLSSRLGMVREFLFPPAHYLLSRYDKSGWYWVPLLYLKYLLGGAWSRITLN